MNNYEVLVREVDGSYPLLDMICQYIETNKEIKEYLEKFLPYSRNDKYVVITYRFFIYRINFYINNMDNNHFLNINYNMEIYTLWGDTDKYFYK